MWGGDWDELELMRIQSPTQAWSAGCLIDLYEDAKGYDVGLLSEGVTKTGLGKDEL